MFTPSTFQKHLHEKLFVALHSLACIHCFEHGTSAYRNLLAENLQLRQLKFGETIVKQRDALDAVYFIAEGQIKLTMNPILHPVQYPTFDVKIKASFSKKTMMSSTGLKQLSIIDRRKLRRNEGFFASERRFRETNICIVGQNGIIGDIEAILDMPTYSVRAECIEELKLYEIDKSSFIRIIVKKNPETFEKMRRSVHEKIRFRNETVPGGIPIYRALLTFFNNVRTKDNRKNILKGYKAKNGAKKRVTSEFFAEMHRGISRNRSRVSLVISDYRIKNRKLRTIYFSQTGSFNISISTQNKVVQS